MNSVEKLKQEILEKTALYFEMVHKEKMNEPFVAGESRVNYAGRFFDEQEMVNLVDSSLDFWLTHGKYSCEFEKKLAEFLEVSWALLVNSGSSANLLAFMALTSPLLEDRQVNRGDEVITVAAAFPTTVAPIVQYGAVPVFVDIESRTCNVNIELLENAISTKTKAIVLAHSLGNPFDVVEVKAFCEKYKLWLIEDNCDALGSLVNGQLTGTFGDIGTSSFYPPHHLTMGEGGAVYTSNPLLKKIMLSLRDWGRDCSCPSGTDNKCGKRFSKKFGKLPLGYDHKYVYSHFGYNLKATDMQAAIGVAQLEKVEQFSKARRKNFEIIKNLLKPYQTHLLLPDNCETVEPSWFGFLIQVKETAPFSRNQITQFLEKNSIQTRNLFSGNILHHPAFETLTENVDYRIASELTETDKVMNNGFWIGVYPGMTDAKLRYMVNMIVQFISTYQIK
ncbi:lipopolysaccharide biosynthesis protein RfbH [Desulfopila sp. IMCC35008]|uniref:lipopolysaccharide biosynthesis protein RfbH n=1 Tax=Desulfopila sp. IMCC35008 TaxID=2653858 RepID=UPI0013D16776|nr:lipopolysaccharide biosynthesis protein RfbH [Desulfopila sp. IMCC35008]